MYIIYSGLTYKNTVYVIAMNIRWRAWNIRWPEKKLKWNNL